VRYRVDVGTDRLELKGDLRDAVLDFRVVRHGPRQRDRGLRLQLLDDDVARPLADRVVNVREPHEAPM
jgi:hypothetical protein